jgi:hypothetical protein
MPVEAIESREEARKGKQCQRIARKHNIYIMHDFLLTRNESHDEGMIALKSKRAFQLNNNY